MATPPTVLFEILTRPLAGFDSCLQPVPMLCFNLLIIMAVNKIYNTADYITDVYLPKHFGNTPDHLPFARHT